MNATFPTVLLALATLSASASDRAVFTLETRLYVYRAADAAPMELPTDAIKAGAQTILFQAPAQVRFGADALALEPTGFTWNGGAAPASPFTHIGTPDVVLPVGKAAALLSAAPIQYLERLPDGAYRVREIPADSPDAPHCRLSFTVQAPPDIDGRLPFICSLEIATLAGREPLEGVSLEVGRPVLARFSDRIEARVPLDHWSALTLNPSPRDSYGLLLLLRFRVHDSSMAESTGPAATAMGPAELDRFVTHYYLRPRPERIADAIDAFGRSGFAEDRGAVYVGFFAAIFAAHPERVETWQPVIDRQADASRDLLREALQRARQPPIVSGPPSVRLNDMSWGAFFATGDPTHLQRLIGHLAGLDDRWDADRFWSAATAMWSLARNAPEHSRVLSTLQAAASTADARTRARIEDVLTRHPDELRQQIAAARQRTRFRDHSNGNPNAHPASNQYQGLTGSTAGDPKYAPGPP